MPYETRERLETLLKRLQRAPIHRFEDPRWLERIEHLLTYLEHWARSDFDFPAPWELDRYRYSSQQHSLERLEKKIDDLLRQPNRCNAPTDFGEKFPSFLTGLTAIADGNLHTGQERLKIHLSDWLEKSRRCVIVDPYIFKNSDRETESDYADGLSAIVGPSVRRVDFYFSCNEKTYKHSIANQVFNDLRTSYAGPPSTTRSICFYACTDLHDRVWLSHDSLANTPPFEGWHARVIGASLNGIRKRPTYVVDMVDDDANDYSKYLKNIRDSLPAGSVTNLPPP